MEQVFAEAELELQTLLQRWADRPREAVIRLLLMALEREEIVSMAYRKARIADRLRLTSLPPDICEIIDHAVTWIWKDEEMHAVYARGALFRLGDAWLRLRALGQQAGGVLAGWATSVLHHAGWGRAPLARLVASTIVLGGRATGKVPQEIGRQLRYLPFRDFCQVNAELEKASWMAWDRLAILAEEQKMVPEMIMDFYRVAEEEIRHLCVFEAIAAGLTPDDRLAPGEDAVKLATRIAAFGRTFLPQRWRGLVPQQQPIGSGGKVWCRVAAAGESQNEALRGVLHEAELAELLRQRALALNKPVAQLRIIVKVCFMLGYNRRDPSPHSDPELIRAFVEFLRDQGCADIAIAESRNLYDQFCERRSVRDVADYLGLKPDGFRVVDLSEDQRAHEYSRGMGQTTVAGDWRDADFRISFGKVRSHPVELALLSLSNLEGVGGRSDQFLFAERQADRAPALLMVLDHFPPHFAVLDGFANVPDGIVGMISCPRPKQPRRLYAGMDALAVDCVAARHLGIKEPGTASLLAATSHWFGGWPENIEVVGNNEPIAGWRGAYSNNWYALLSLLALPVYVWGSGRGSLFLPLMDAAAFPERRRAGPLLRLVRCLIRGLLGLRSPKRI